MRLKYGGLQPRTQRLSLSCFVFILCNRSPPGPRSLVEAGGGVVVVFFCLFVFYPGTMNTVGPPWTDLVA